MRLGRQFPVAAHLEWCWLQRLPGFSTGRITNGENVLGVSNIGAMHADITRRPQCDLRSIISPRHTPVFWYKEVVELVGCALHTYK